MISKAKNGISREFEVQRNSNPKTAFGCRYISLLQRNVFGDKEGWCNSRKFVCRQKVCKINKYCARGGCGWQEREKAVEIKFAFLSFPLSHPPTYLWAIHLSFFCLLAFWVCFLYFFWLFQLEVLDFLVRLSPQDNLTINRWKFQMVCLFDSCICLCVMYVLSSTDV